MSFEIEKKKATPLQPVYHWMGVMGMFSKTAWSTTDVEYDYYVRVLQAGVPAMHGFSYHLRIPAKELNSGPLCTEIKDGVYKLWSVRAVILINCVEIAFETGEWGCWCTVLPVRAMVISYSLWPVKVD